jgi:tryptophanyl-tRNA synthetase
VEVKQRLIVALNEFLAPIQERRRGYGASPSDVGALLREGTRLAREEAGKTMARVRAAMGIDYLCD